MKKIAAFVLAAALLLLCACGETVPEETGVESSPEKARTAAIEYISEEETAMRAALEQASGLPVLAFYSSNFAGIAYDTVFAVMGSDLSRCALWYWKNNGDDEPVEAAVYADGLASLPEAVSLGEGDFDEAILAVTRADGLVDIWGILAQDPHLFDISGTGMDFQYQGDARFTLRHEGKPYWFYKDTRCYEYGGLEITKEQLLGCEGAAEILDGLVDIKEIYYRGNGIINANHGGGYVTLRLTGVAVEEIGRGAGSYQPLMAPDNEWTLTPCPAGVFADAALAGILAAHTEKPTISFDLHDYDGDGTREAFVLVGEDTETGFEQAGELWFVSQDGAQLLEDSAQRGWGWVGINEVYTFGKQKYMLITTLMAQTESNTLWWTVKDGKPFWDMTISGRGGISEPPEGNTFCLWYTMLDSGREYNPENPEEGYLMGRSSKKYWFYYDNGVFREYGGLEITEKQLRRCAGAGKILDELKAKGHTISEIYYRGNGIININSSVTEIHEDCGWISYDHINLRLENGAVTPLALEDWEGGGSYAAASKPELAVYPSLPKVMQ